MSTRQKLLFHRDAWEDQPARGRRDGFGECIADLAKLIPRGIKHDSVCNKIRRALLRRSGMVIGSYSYIYQYVTIVCPSRISIGEHSFINQNCVLSAYGGISIGNRVSIGYNVLLLTEDHDYTSDYFKVETAGITIRDNVWLGSNSIICKGVVVGEGAVVCAGSVVTREVKPYTIVGGTPARYIKDRIIE